MTVSCPPTVIHLYVAPTYTAADEAQAALEALLWGGLAELAEVQQAVDRALAAGVPEETVRLILAEDHSPDEVA